MSSPVNGAGTPSSAAAALHDKIAAKKMAMALLIPCPLRFSIARRAAWPDQATIPAGINPLSKRTKLAAQYNAVRCPMSGRYFAGRPRKRSSACKRRENQFLPDPSAHRGIVSQLQKINRAGVHCVRGMRIRNQTWRPRRPRLRLHRRRRTTAASIEMRSEIQRS